MPKRVITSDSPSTHRVLFISSEDPSELKALLEKSLEKEWSLWLIGTDTLTGSPGYFLTKGKDGRPPMPSMMGTHK